MTPSTWTDVRISLLREFVAKRYSCAEMAAQIGVTRNAVIGKLHRLGLSTGNTKKSQKKEGVGRRKRFNAGPQVQAIRTRIANRVEDLEQNANELLREPDEIVPLHIGLMDLTEATCRFPYGNKSPFTFCGCAKIDDGPYCYGHWQIARVAPQPPRARTSAEIYKPRRERRAA